MKRNRQWPHSRRLDNTVSVDTLPASSASHLDLPSNENPFSAGAPDPFPCFRAWLAAAEAFEPNDPNTMALATATPNGLPSVRMVLLKEVTVDSFVFYTNAQSRKGEELRANPHAALCFHWKTLRRQIRIEGPITEIAGPRADAYFHSRARASQLGALASQQSRPLSDRATLEARVAELAGRYPNEIPRPSHWTGFAVLARQVEFWRSGADRLHDRMLYSRLERGWQRTLLYP